MRFCLSLAMSMFLGASALHAEVVTMSYEGQNSPGYTFASFIVDKQEQCAVLCMNRDLCSLAAFSHEDNHCDLKSQSSVYENAASYTLILKILAGQDNVGFIKGDYASMHFNLWDECSRACYVDSKCKVFTFNKTTGECWLKNQIVYKEINSNAISGQR